MTTRALTEQEWLTADSPVPLLQHVRRQSRVAQTPAGRRRLRLFGCACCRSAWEHFADERYRRAVEVGERFADGAAGQDELATVRAAVEDVEHIGPPPHDREKQQAGVVRYRVASATFALTATSDLVRAMEDVARQIRELRLAIAERAWGPAQPMAATLAAEARTQAALVRDIFGNPFRPTVINPAWLSGNDGAVSRLARAIYDEGAFDRLALLADALEEAGCTDASVLAHCRGPGPHARGCWAVDLARDRG